MSVVLGGPAAISDTVLGQVPKGTRVAGPDRAGTAAAVATKVWGVTRTPQTDNSSPSTAGCPMAGVTVWRWPSLAADAGAPILLANSLSPDQPPSTSTMMASCDTSSVDLVVAGAITDTLARTLKSVDGTTC